MFTYLSWHPEICCSDIKETHFFSDHNYFKKHTNYEDFFSQNKSKNIWLEASPEYIYGKHKTAGLIKEYNPNAKIIFIFRNPSEKILSSFKHRKKKLIFPEDYNFSSFYNEHLSFSSLEEVNSKNPYSKELLEGSYIDYLPVWYEYFSDSQIKVLFFDDLKDNPHLVIQELCSWLNLNESVYNNKSFEIENKSVNFKYSKLQKVAQFAAKKFEPFLRKNYTIKKNLRKLYYRLNVKTLAQTEEPSLNELDKLYRFKNKQLKEFLEDKKYFNIPKWLEDCE